MYLSGSASAQDNIREKSNYYKQELKSSIRSITPSRYYPESNYRDYIKVKKKEIKNPVLLCNMSRK